MRLTQNDYQTWVNSESITGIEFANIDRYAIGEEPFKLLKLHGSFNWLWSRITGNVYFGGFRKSIGDILDLNHYYEQELEYSGEPAKVSRADPHHAYTSKRPAQRPPWDAVAQGRAGFARGAPGDLHRLFASARRSAHQVSPQAGVRDPTTPQAALYHRRGLCGGAEANPGAEEL